jgi:predicted acyltransferase (DUF342 family)
MTVPYIFGTESSPIPLSQLDANFAVIPAFANTAGNVSNAAQPAITSVGTLVALSVAGDVVSGNVSTGMLTVDSIQSQGNIVTNSSISAYGNVTGQNIFSSNEISGNVLFATTLLATNGTLFAGSITTQGNVSTQQSFKAQGQVSAVGNIITDQYFVGNFQGNIAGNITVGGSNTQVLFNNNGSVGAVGGLTYNSGSNTLSVLGVVSAQGNIVGGNLTVGGTTQLSGLTTAPTPTVGTANNQVATTAFVNNQIANTAGTLGTLNWEVVQIGTTLYFQFNGANVAKLDQSGNFTTINNITAYGAPL